MPGAKKDKLEKVLILWNEGLPVTIASATQSGERGAAARLSRLRGWWWRRWWGFAHHRKSALVPHQRFAVARVSAAPPLVLLHRIGKKNEKALQSVADTTRLNPKPGTTLYFLAYLLCGDIFSLKLKARVVSLRELSYRLRRFIVVPL